VWARAPTLWPVIRFLLIGGAAVPASVPGHPTLDASSTRWVLPPLGRAGALPTAEAASDGASDVLVPVVSILAAVVIAVALSALIGAFVKRVARRSTIAADLTRRSRVPLRSVLIVVAIWIAVRIGADPSHWRRVVEHLLLIALIVAVTWLVGSLAFVLEDAAVARYRTDVADNRHARRVRTQVQVLRRVTVAVLVVCAAAGIALTFPSARAFGASLLASAGLLSIVAGLAAQSSLANVFAGMQLAFTDAIRVDDVVVVDGQWGRIEELTLTYVVVHAWDDRRLILPSTFFTTTPFENWTRRAAELLGTVELDVDWAVPVQSMRDELTRLLDQTDLWDRRVGILQVVDAVGGSVRVRALASAVDAPTLFDLRCYVREGLVEWAQSQAPQAIPRSRWEQGPTAAATPPDVPPVRDEQATAGLPATGPLPLPGGWAVGDTADDAHALAPVGRDSRLFTGSVEALERSRHFQGPGQDVIDEREHHAEPDQDTRAGQRATAQSVTAGKATAQPARSEPRRTEPRSAETRRTEPQSAEPRPVEPRPVEPRPAEPLPVEPLPAEPLPAGPRRAGPGPGEYPSAGSVTGPDEPTEPSTVDDEDASASTQVIGPPIVDEPRAPRRREAGHRRATGDDDA
jgi:small-conductance mechanosensitive channel